MSIARAPARPSIRRRKRAWDPIHPLRREFCLAQSARFRRLRLWYTEQEENFRITLWTPEMTARDLAAQRRYCREVLSHTNTAWWGRRKHLHPLADDMLQETCSDCGVTYWPRHYPHSSAPGELVICGYCYRRSLEDQSPDDVMSGARESRTGRQLALVLAETAGAR